MKNILNLSAVILRLYLREPLTVFLSIGLLVLMMIMFGVMGTGDIANLHLPVAVLDLSQGTSNAAALIARDSVFTSTIVHNEAEIGEMLHSARAVLGVVIRKPNNPDGNTNGQNIEIVAPDQSGNHWTAFAVEHLTNLLTVRAGAAPAIPIHYEHSQVVNNRFIDFIFPGVMSLAVLEASLTSVMLLLSAKKLGVLRRLQITPLNSTHLLGGFLLGRFIIIVIHLAILVLVATTVFRARIQAPFGVVALDVGLGILCFMSLAAVVAQLAPSYEAGAIITQLLNFPMAFLSGVFFRNENLPPVMQYVANLLPLTHLVDLMRGTIQAGLPLTKFYPQMGILVAWTLLCFAIFIVLSRGRQFTAE